jgi:hypothetical protein
MEQPCYKCGQAVEEGIPFCPHCSAPQIRVVVAEPPPGPVAAANLSTTSDGTAVLPMVQVAGLPVRGSPLLKSCALAALVACVLVVLGLNLLVAMIGAGFLSVVFHRQRLRGTAPNSISGAGIGALAGLFFFALITGMMALASAFPDVRSKFREQLVEYVQKVAASRPSEPQLQTLVEQLKTPEGFTIVMIAFGCLLLILAPVIAGIGGALAGALFGRRSKL